MGLRELCLQRISRSVQKTLRKTKSRDLWSLEVFLWNIKYNDNYIHSEGFEAFQTVLEFAEQREKFKAFRIPMVVLPATISNNVPGKMVAVAVFVSALESISISMIFDIHYMIYYDKWHTICDNCYFM